MGIFNLLFGKDERTKELEERWKMTLKEARTGINEMDEARKKLKEAKENIHARAKIRVLGDESGRKEGRNLEKEGRISENGFIRREFKSSPG
jgi:hypothetical protein